MADDYDLVSYKDISDLKKDLEGIKDKKDVSPKDLNEAMHRLADTMGSLLEVFGAAAEQMKLEEKESESDFKKHEMIISKLDKLIDQNKTIAEAMVAIVDMFKEKFPQREKEESMFRADAGEQMPKPRAEPNMFTSQPKSPAMPPSMPQMNAMMPPMMPTPSMPNQPMPGSSQDFGMNLPPMEPSPMPDFDFPEDSFKLDDDAQKRKGLFGMFKK